MITRAEYRARGTATYSWGTIGIFTLYGIACFAAPSLIANVEAVRGSPAATFAVAVSPGVFIMGWLAIFTRFVMRWEEMWRRAMTTALAISAGVLSALLTAYGFLEAYADYPRFPLLLTFPLFIAVKWTAFTILMRRYSA